MSSSTTHSAFTTSDQTFTEHAQRHEQDSNETRPASSSRRTGSSALCTRVRQERAPGPWAPCSAAQTPGADVRVFPRRIRPVPTLSSTLAPVRRSNHARASDTYPTDARTHSRKRAWTHGVGLWPDECPPEMANVRRQRQRGRRRRGTHTSFAIRGLNATAMRASPGYSRVLRIRRQRGKQSTVSDS